MKLRTIFFSLLIILFSNLLFGENDESFKISFLQNGNEIEIKDHVIELEKAPFQLVLSFPKPMGVLVNFSKESDNYRGFATGQSLDDIFGNAGRFMGIAEELFNPDKAVILDDSKGHKLFYDTANNNRFDEVKVGLNEIICIRSIEKYTTCGEMKDDIYHPIDELTNSSLYIIFSYSEWDENWERVELERNYIKINFKERA